MFSNVSHTAAWSASHCFVDTSSPSGRHKNQTAFTTKSRRNLRDEQKMQPHFPEYATKLTYTDPQSLSWFPPLHLPFWTRATCVMIQIWAIVHWRSENYQCSVALMWRLAPTRHTLVLGMLLCSFFGIVRLVNWVTLGPDGARTTGKTCEQWSQSVLLNTSSHCVCPFYMMIKRVVVHETSRMIEDHYRYDAPCSNKRKTCTIQSFQQSRDQWS